MALTITLTGNRNEAMDCILKRISSKRKEKLIRRIEKD